MSHRGLNMQTFKKQIFLLLIGFIFFSCGKTDTSVAPELPDVETAPVITKIVELAPVETPEYKQAMITFITGDVFMLEDGEWIYAEIGDFLEKDDSIQVESDSYCEIQFGDRAVVRVEANTELALSSVFMKPDETKIGIDLVAGSVLVKVQKLTGGEKFNVSTPSTVCGVRGTEFSVKLESGAETVLAVKEGAVAILPPELNIEELIEKVGESGETVAAILEQIESSASVVVADEEISLTENSFKEIKESVQLITEIVEAIAFADKNEKVVSDAVFENLITAAETVTAIVADEEIAVKVLSDENKDSLKNIEEMRMISIPVAKTQAKDNAEKDTENEAEPLISLHKFSLKVVPSNAEIFLNAKSVGKGSFSGIFEEGDILDFEIVSNNFESQNINFIVSDETSRQYTISLTENKIKPEPDSEKEESTALVEEKVVEVKEEADKKDTVIEEVSLDKSSSVDSVVTEKLFAVSVRIKPSDSNLIINGDSVFSHKFDGEFPAGTSIEVKGSRNGFVDKSLLITVGDKNIDSVILNLEARPLESSLSVSSARLVGSVTTGAGLIFTTDSRGTVNAVNSEGHLVWSVNTGNKSIENSYPVFSNNRVYLSGSTEFVILNAANGELIKRESLDKNSAHIFGRRLVPAGDQSLFPQNNEIKVLNSSNGDLIRIITLPGSGSRMTPAVWKNKILSVDQNGTVSIIDINSGVVDFEISTSGSQPIALSLTVINNLAVFSGRKGNVVCLDLESESVLWEKQLIGDGSKVQVYTDIVCSNSGAYIYTKGNIFGLNLNSGKDLFSVIKDASSPPVLIDSSLVFGTVDNKLKFINSNTGRLEKELELTETISARPVVFNDLIAVGTSSGEIIIINPEGVR